MWIDERRTGDLTKSFWFRIMAARYNEDQRVWRVRHDKEAGRQAVWKEFIDFFISNKHNSWRWFSHGCKHVGHVQLIPIFSFRFWLRKTALTHNMHFSAPSLLQKQWLMGDIITGQAEPLTSDINYPPSCVLHSSEDINMGTALLFSSLHRKG